MRAAARPAGGQAALALGEAPERAEAVAGGALSPAVRDFLVVLREWVGEDGDFAALFEPSLPPLAVVVGGGFLMTPGELERARVAVWLLSRASDAAGAAVPVSAEVGAVQCGCLPVVFRNTLARFAALGAVTLAVRAGVYYVTSTEHGQVRLRAYVLGYAAHVLLGEAQLLAPKKGVAK